MLAGEEMADSLLQDILENVAEPIHASTPQHDVHISGSEGSSGHCLESGTQEPLDKDASTSQSDVHVLSGGHNVEVVRCSGSSILLDNDLPNPLAEEPLNKRMRRDVPPVSPTGQFLFHQPYSQSLGGSNAGGDFSDWLTHRYKVPDGTNRDDDSSSSYSLSRLSNTDVGIMGLRDLV